MTQVFQLAPPPLYLQDFPNPNLKAVRIDGDLCRVICQPHLSDEDVASAFFSHPEVNSDCLAWSLQRITTPHLPGGISNNHVFTPDDAEDVHPQMYGNQVRMYFLIHFDKQCKGHEND